VAVGGLDAETGLHDTKGKDPHFAHLDAGWNLSRRRFDNDKGSVKVPLRVHQGEAVTCRRATGRQGSDQFDWECACRASLESDVWILRMLAGEEIKSCWLLAGKNLRLLVKKGREKRRMAVGGF